MPPNQRCSAARQLAAGRGRRRADDSYLSISLSLYIYILCIHYSMYVCMYVCMYVYIYIYIYIFMCAIAVLEVLTRISSFSCSESRPWGLKRLSGRAGLSSGLGSPASRRGRDELCLHRRATNPLHVAIWFVTCAHVATFCSMLFLHFDTFHFAHIFTQSSLGVIAALLRRPPLSWPPSGSCQ